MPHTMSHISLNEEVIRQVVIIPWEIIWTTSETEHVWFHVCLRTVWVKVKCNAVSNHSSQITHASENMGPAWKSTWEKLTCDNFTFITSFSVQWRDHDTWWVGSDVQTFSMQFTLEDNEIVKLRCSMVTLAHGHLHLEMNIDVMRTTSLAKRHGSETTLMMSPFTEKNDIHDSFGRSKLDTTKPSNMTCVKFFTGTNAAATSIPSGNIQRMQIRSLECIHGPIG